MIENLTDYERLKCLFVIQRVCFFFLESGEDLLIVYNDGTMKLDNSKNKLLSCIKNKICTGVVDGEETTGFIESFWHTKQLVSERDSEYYGNVTFGYDKYLDFVYNREEDI
jgi:hypothetical protein